MKATVCPFWSCFRQTIYDISPWTLSNAETPVTMWYVKRKETFFCIQIQLVDRTQFDMLSYFCNIVCRMQGWHPERNLLVIISHSFNTKSTSPRLQFLSLFKMTDCQTYSPSTSSLQSHIIQHLNQTYISIKTRQNSILRLAQRRCVPFHLHERGRENEGRERQYLCFVHSPL